MLMKIFLLDSFKEPPSLTGALEPNVKLRQAERLFENQLVGPESIANIGGKHGYLIEIFNICLISLHFFPEMISGF